jgi:hypothetical protein
VCVCVCGSVGGCICVYGHARMCVENACACVYVWGVYARICMCESARLCMLHAKVLHVACQNLFVHGVVAHVCDNLSWFALAMRHSLVSIRPTGIPR